MPGAREAPWAVRKAAFRGSAGVGLIDFRRPAISRKPLMRNSLLEVTPVIPGSLSRLPELAGNLFFSWHRPTRALFEDLDPELWKQTNGNPRLMLRCINQENLDRCAADEQLPGALPAGARDARCLSEGRAPRAPMSRWSPISAPSTASTRAFRSTPGGLGVLAGDYCKAASDERANFVARGAALRAGLFHPDGRQRRRAARRNTASATRATCRSSRCATPAGELAAR